MGTYSTSAIVRSVEAAQTFIGTESFDSCSVARVLSADGQASRTSFDVLSANPAADLSSAAPPAMLVDPVSRTLPWTLAADQQSLPDR